ncbi:glutamine amidotransferase-like class 1 domain-containing protein 1 [Dendrobates tinctorius]|uniref:glutamine amidotransferase-like class 1 domain-containing protein 1 n=1 Tax=Dendrobates tinctorius TaxID=92724 RepID=UPI003CCA5CBA
MALDFVGISEIDTRWFQDFHLKPYANPARLEPIDETNMYSKTRRGVETDNKPRPSDRTEHIYIHGGRNKNGSHYHALLIPHCSGAMTDLANSGYLARILQHFKTEKRSKSTEGPTWITTPHVLICV